MSNVLDNTVGGGPAFPAHEIRTVDTNDIVQNASQGMSLRAYLAAHGPVDFTAALLAWGDPGVNLGSDDTRAAFFAVWAMMRVEFADAMLAELAR